jgi:hypothetical protein
VLWPLSCVLPHNGSVDLLFVLWGNFALAIRYGIVCFTLITFNPGLGLLTTNTAVWYFGSSLIIACLIIALAIYAFYAALGGQKVFTGKLLEE